MECIKINTTIRIVDIEIIGVPCHKCPNCGREFFSRGVVDRTMEIADELGFINTTGFVRALSRSGKSELVLRIPKEICNELSLTEKDTVEIFAHGTGIKVKIQGRTPYTAEYFKGKVLKRVKYEVS